MERREWRDRGAFINIIHAAKSTRWTLGWAAPRHVIDWRSLLIGCILAQTQQTLRELLFWEQTNKSEAPLILQRLQCWSWWIVNCCRWIVNCCRSTTTSTNYKPRLSALNVRALNWKTRHHNDGLHLLSCSWACPCAGTTFGGGMVCDEASFQELWDSQGMFIRFYVSECIETECRNLENKQAWLGARIMFMEEVNSVRKYSSSAFFFLRVFQMGFSMD